MPQRLVFPDLFSMGVTLDQILMLAGRLDDAPGFDAPRQRFRRFLLDHIRDAQIARALIEQCQHAPGTQHRRALQDLVVLVGRFIGFQVTFGPHLPVDVGVKCHGHWQSRPCFQVVVDVKSDQTDGTDVDRLLRSVAALAATSPSSSSRSAGLSVLTPSYMTGHRVEEAVAAAEAPGPVGVVTLGALLSLADMVSAGRVTHEDVVRLLKSNIAVDFIVDLLQRSSDGRVVETSQDTSTASSPVLAESGFWIVTVASDHGSRPEELLELVVAKRRIFGITDRGTPGRVVRSGDWLCFYISGKGVVGHARVSALTNGGSGIRGAHRFRQVLRLEDLKLHLAAPVGVDLETELRLRTAPLSADRHAQTLVGISRESFEAMTARVSARRDPSFVWTEATSEDTDSTIPRA